MKQHRILDADIESKTGTCTVCGPTRVYVSMNRGMPRARCTQGAKPAEHRLSDVDLEAGTGECSSCGQTRVWVRKPSSGPPYGVCVKGSKPSTEDWHRVSGGVCLTCGPNGTVVEDKRTGRGLCRLAKLMAVAKVHAKNRGYAPPDVTPAQLGQAVKDCAGRCPVCLKDRPLLIDHCHDTGRFRGLLCDRCNRGIGMLGDSAEPVQRALDYLRR